VLDTLATVNNDDDDNDYDRNNNNNNNNNKYKTFNMGNNIRSTVSCKYRVAATPYTLET